MYVWISTEDRRRSPRTWLHTVGMPTQLDAENKIWVLWKAIKSSQPPTQAQLPGLKPQILTWYSKLYISNIILVLCQSQGSLQSWSCLHPDYWHVLPHWNYLTSFPQFSSCSLTGELLFIDKAGSYLLGSMLWNLPALWSSCHYHRIKASLARGLSLCLSS